jgi:hypothetical protein
MEIAKSVDPARRAMTVTVKAGRHQTGTLVLQLPNQYEFFCVDPQDGREVPGIGPLTYLEVRFRGSYRTRDAFFALPRRTGHYSFVLQGSGGRCMYGGTYRAWWLQLGEDVPDDCARIFGTVASRDRK